MFDEMYLQKCEEYFAGDLVGCISEGELYKGLVCFMIVGLKNSIPYVIKSSPETKINADWLKEELIDCLGTLPKSAFIVRAIVCDNHPLNVSSFKNLLQYINQDPDELFIWYELRKTYLFYDAVHLMKNIRNNLSKVRLCKLYNSKCMTASTQITNTEIFAFIAVLVFMLLSRKFLFINIKDNRNC